MLSLSVNKRQMSKWWWIKLFFFTKSIQELCYLARVYFGIFRRPYGEIHWNLSFWKIQWFTFSFAYYGLRNYDGNSVILIPVTTRRLVAIQNQNLKRKFVHIFLLHKNRENLVIFLLFLFECALDARNCSLKYSKK